MNCIGSKLGNLGEAVAHIRQSRFSQNGTRGGVGMQSSCEKPVSCRKNEKRPLLAISVGLQWTKAGQVTESKPESKLQGVLRVGLPLGDRLPQQPHEEAERPVPMAMTYWDAQTALCIKCKRRNYISTQQ